MIEQRQIRAATWLLTSFEPYASGRMWTKASPTRAPQPKANNHFIRMLKQASEQHLLQVMTMMAAMNPIRETPKPARNPKPQI